MRLSRRNIGLIATVLVLLFAASGCRVRVPLPPQPYVRVPRGSHYAPPHARAARYHYRYYPGTEVYFDTTSNIYFYLSNNIWLSAPLLPSHIRIDLNNFVTMELGGPKPFIYHRDTVKRYPPGLRKDQHRKQREKLLDKREDKRDRWDSKKTRQEEQLQRKKDRLDRREDDLERRENRLERRKEKQEDIEKRRKDQRKEHINNRTEVKKRAPEAEQEARKSKKTKLERREEEQDSTKKSRKDLRRERKNRTEAKKRSKETPPEVRKRRKAKKKKKGEDEEEDVQEIEQKGRRKAIWK